MKPVKKREFLKYTAMGAAVAVAAVVAVAVVAVGCGSSSGPALPAAGELSRAQFVAQISDYFGWFHSSNYNDIWKVPLRTFSDVKATDQYGKQIECAYEEDIIAPDASGKFNPTLAMTRQDAAVVFAKAFFLTTPSDTRPLDKIGRAHV